MASEGRTRSNPNEGDSGMVRMERGMALILAITAAVLGVIGLLRGFGIVGPEGIDADLGGIAEAGGVQAAVESDFWEGVLWMLPAFAFGIIAWQYASARAHPGDEVQSPMRAVALTLAGTTIVLGVLALLVGFGMINENAQPTDGVLWGLTAVLGGLLTSAAHAAIPSPVPDEEYLVALVDARVAPGATDVRTQEGRRGIP